MKILIALLLVLCDLASAQQSAELQPSQSNTANTIVSDVDNQSVSKKDSFKNELADDMIYYIKNTQVSDDTAEKLLYLHTNFQKIVLFAALLIVIGAIAAWNFVGGFVIGSSLLFQQWQQRKA